MDQVYQNWNVEGLSRKAEIHINAHAPVVNLADESVKFIHELQATYQNSRSKYVVFLMDDFNVMFGQDIPIIKEVGINWQNKKSTMNAKMLYGFLKAD